MLFEALNFNFAEVSPAKRDDTAMVMYTSGTTGAAKGVILTHYNIVTSVAGLGAGASIIRDTDTYIGYLPLAHILEVGAELTCLVSFFIRFVFIERCKQV